VTEELREVEFHHKLRFLLEPHPYKILFGGRDGIKSWGFAIALVTMGARYRVRFLCTRETQKSIAESVHRLLADQIERLGLGDYYRVEKARIVGTVEHKTRMYARPLERPGFSEFVFAGLKHNVNQIKSFEDLDGVWVEEAANVSKNSWEVIIPTIRKQGSEIWVSFNPELDSDECYKRWVLNPPPDAVVVRTSWQDNRWLSQTSRDRIELLKERDPDTYDVIYGGATRSAFEGAVYRAEIAAMEKEGRLTKVPYDPAKPVETFWDLGYGDNTAIWFAQAFPFEYRIIDYLDGEREPLSYYLRLLQNRGYVYGTHWLPHDARAKSLGTGKSIEELTRAAGLKVAIVPSLSIKDGINAARNIFPLCWFDSEKCAEGVQHLRRYRYGVIQTLGVPTREPLHDEASHAADGFRYLAVGIKAPRKEPPKTEHVRRVITPWS
jgi:phage terminase large subunit